VGSRAVQEAIVSRLRRHRVPAQDIEDMQQLASEALLREKDEPPTEERCAALARTVVDRDVVDMRRRLARRGKVDVGPTDGADETAHDDGATPLALASLERDEQVKLVDEKLGDGSIAKRTAKMLRLKADGLTDAEIAKRLDCAPQTVSNALAAARKEIRAAWAKRLAVLTGALAVLGLIFWMSREPGETAHAPPPVPSELPGALPAPSAKPASELRREAFTACEAKRWAECAALLDRARDADPSGEALPEVQAARRAIAEAGAKR
jgi:RNA polymerase sigma factor (sigma-70 family)